MGNERHGTPGNETHEEEVGIVKDAKVVVDWGLCDGHGACASEAPEVFELDDDDNLLLLREDIPAELLPKVAGHR